MSLSRTDSGPTYAKIIGANIHGRYPYRIGLNTLAHNGERFNAMPECGPGGLYYCEIKNVMKWLSYGDTLCIVKPVGRVVAVGSKFKTDRLVIVEMLSLQRADAAWRFLLEHDAIVSRRAALLWAADKGHLNVVKFLVLLGVDLHADDESALRAAAGNGRLCVVKFLVNHGANVRARNDEALSLAEIGMHFVVVAYLIEHGAVPVPSIKFDQHPEDAGSPSCTIL